MVSESSSQGFHLTVFLNDL